MNIFKRFNLFYIAIFLIFFIPRVIDLGADIANYDSSFWYPRMEEFTKELLRGEYKQTYQKYHPGVTLLWTSGTSKHIFETAFEAISGNSPRYNPYQFTRLHFASKFPLVLMISIMGLAIFYMVEKMTNRKFALIFAIMLSLEPFFLGISRFLHLSALTSMFMFTSFVILFYYYREKQSLWLFNISAVLMGLAILTKVDGIISLPVNALLIAYFEFKNKSGFLQLIKRGLLYIAVVAITFYLLFPSMWVAPIWTIHKMIIDGIQDTAFSSSGADTWTEIRELFYLETIFFRSLPTTVLAILIGIYAGFFKNIKNLPKSFLYWVLFYTAFNIIILTIPEKIKDRYLINLYPPIMIFASVGIYFLLETKRKAVRYFTIGVLTAAYLLTIYAYHPVYSFYHSDLTGGASGHERLGLPVINRGEFYAQAAHYINKNDSNPVVRNVVLSEREHLRTFPRFFYGETFNNPKFMKDGYFADYIITDPPGVILVPEEHCELEQTFGPRGPFGYKALYLFKCEGITNEYEDFTN